MRLQYKICISLLLIVLIIGGFVLFAPEKHISAEDTRISFLQCSEPIPTGEAYEKTFMLTTETYNEYVNLRNYLSSAVKQIQSEVSELYRKDEKACDFSLCAPLVIDQAPDIKLKVSYIIGTATTINVHLPLCKTQPCIGQPCSDMKKYIEEITGLRNAVKASHEVIDEMFNLETYPVTADIQKKESLGSLIRRPEEVHRRQQLAREWLHAAADKGKNSCSLSERERKKVVLGEIGDRYPMRCVDALDQGLYWPRIWSENCSKKCRPESDIDKCKKCLSNDKNGTSILAEINYKTYGICQDSCDNQFDEQCKQCMCKIQTNNERAKYGKDVGEQMTDDECVAWLCGGSYYNNVCCYEELIEVE